MLDTRAYTIHTPSLLQFKSLTLIMVLRDRIVELLNLINKEIENK